MTTHTCDAIVVFCIDFRFQRYIHNWLDKNFADKLYDYVGYAGGTKELTTILKQIDLSVKLHDIKEVILMHHENCGAYGTQGTPEQHAKDLRKAKEEITRLYPTLKVTLYYLHLDGEFELIS